MNLNKLLIDIAEKDLAKVRQMSAQYTEKGMPLGRWWVLGWPEQSMRLVIGKDGSAASVHAEPRESDVANISLNLAEATYIKSLYFNVSQMGKALDVYRADQWLRLRAEVLRRQIEEMKADEALEYRPAVSAPVKKTIDEVPALKKLIPKGYFVNIDNSTYFLDTITGEDPRNLRRYTEGGSVEEALRKLKEFSSVFLK